MKEDIRRKYISDHLRHCKRDWNHWIVDLFTMKVNSTKNKKYLISIKARVEKKTKEHLTFGAGPKTHKELVSYCRAAKTKPARLSKLIRQVLLINLLASFRLAVKYTLLIFSAL